MSSASENAAPPPLTKPTLFLSYASEDREAARRLRDTLLAAGLDVWYDESDLGGGDAWDQKIRRQIRECDYFMPVVSATTDRRKEGYFRREWRLAVERTLDMADDVMFLLPVTIDGSRQATARVPDKFLAVQWLHLPGGGNTPALEALCRRLSLGDHSLFPPSGAKEKIASPRVPPPAHSEGPPPMPPFPHMPDKGNMGHGLKFFAEAVWWMITAGWLLLKRAPRWLRIILSIWVSLWLMSRCSSSLRHSSSDAAKPKAAERAQIEKVIATATQATDEKSKGAEGNDAGDVGAKILRGLAAGLKELDATDKRLVAIPFFAASASDAETKFLVDTFSTLYGRLAIERAGEIAVSSDSLMTPTDQALLSRAKLLDAAFVLGGHLEKTDDSSMLVVHLLRVADGSIVWSGEYAAASGDPTGVADQIAKNVIATVPKK